MAYNDRPTADDLRFMDDVKMTKVIEVHTEDEISRENGRLRDALQKIVELAHYPDATIALKALEQPHKA